MNIINIDLRPDQLTAGLDHIYDPNSRRWEPVKDAYWSEVSQRYVVYLGTLKEAGPMHLYMPGARVNSQRYYT